MKLYSGWARHQGEKEIRREGKEEYMNMKDILSNDTNL